MYEILLAARTGKGRAIVNFIGMEAGEKVAAIVEIAKIEPGRFVVTLTRSGQIKKTELTDYENFREKGIIGVKIEEGADRSSSAAVTDGTRDILIATKLGQSIRFGEDQVRPMGRATMGVRGIDVEEGDAVVGLEVSDDARKHVLAVCENGFGKRTDIEEFRKQNRGGKGIILIDASERNGPVVGIRLVKPEDEVMLITDRGQTIRTGVGDIRETGRNAQGVKLMALEGDERIVAFERLAESSAEGIDGQRRRARRPSAGEPASAPAASSERAELTDDDASRGRSKRRRERDRPAATTLAPMALAPRLARQHPTAHCELDHRSPFELIVSVVLSAQTTDVAVNKATPALFARFPTRRRWRARSRSTSSLCVSTLGLLPPEGEVPRGPGARRSSRSTAARCRVAGRSWSRCPGWAVRRRTSCWGACGTSPRGWSSTRT